MIRFQHVDLVRGIKPLLEDADATLNPGERIGLALARLLGPLIPRRYRPVKAEAIARRLLEEALNPASGTVVIESDAI